MVQFSCCNQLELIYPLCVFHSLIVYLYLILPLLSGERVIIFEFCSLGSLWWITQSYA